MDTGLAAWYQGQILAEQQAGPGAAESAISHAEDRRRDSVPNWSLAAATADQAAELAAIAALTFPLACPPELTVAQIVAFVEQELKPSDFARYLADEANIVFISHDDAGDPLGYLLALPEAGTDPAAAAQLRGTNPVYLSKCYAAPRAHGTGLATTLVKALFDEAARRGHDSVWLGTNEANLRARRFYEKQGFQLVGERKFVVGGKVCSDVTYELLLDS